MSTDYATHCAWCHAELNGRYITFLPAYDHQIEDYLMYGDLDEHELAVRYCSAKCVTARRGELFHRRKLLFGDEKWPRFAAEVPPELAAMLDRAQLKALVGDASSASRARIVRAGLHMYLDKYAPVEEPAITGEADLEPLTLAESREQR